jgi:hypothetical protein
MLPSSSARATPSVAVLNWLLVFNSFSINIIVWYSNVLEDSKLELQFARNYLFYTGHEGSQLSNFLSHIETQ